ncbi:unnamed protein product [Adineta steineri]|uniref:Uncharacterized protein n=1 Tax=Adineta steineri TaxID=433720 RepID=A0A815JUR7_9BILA|nr:unnamed protein product [Adineta steineri]CAF4040369.1 unnamed protein product [Adineta steineri]
MANNKTLCCICNEEKITYPCEGCSKRFCFVDLEKHRQILNDELHHITNEYNEFKQTINEQKQNPQNHSVMNQINQWEIQSIEIIQKKHKTQIIQIRKENEFNETNLNYLRNQLIEITEELNNPSSISAKQNSQRLINEISRMLSKKSKFKKWKQNAITVAGGNERGQELNQLNGPEGVFIDKNKNVFIADYSNHRIVKWKHNAKEGKIIAGGNRHRNLMNQLTHPTDVIVDQQTHSIIIADRGNRRVIQWLNQNQQILIENISCWGLAMDKHGFLYVCDLEKNEVQRWKMGEYNNEGIVVAGGNGRGNQLNQLDYPTFIFVDEDQSIYVSDTDNNRVMKWRKDAKEGTLVAGGNDYGINLNQLYHPQGVVVDHLGQIYVAEWGNDRVVRWCEGKQEGEIVVGGSGRGNQLNQLNHPSSLSFDDEGNLCVADSGNDRIAKFEIIL